MNGKADSFASFYGDSAAVDNADPGLMGAAVDITHHNGARFALAHRLTIEGDLVPVTLF